ncbi:MAG: c-type cytochrome [Thermoleophilia bacterium]|nr:c-type cytochrome [Thermoleophilia bacterium]
MRPKLALSHWRRLEVTLVSLGAAALLVTGCASVGYTQGTGDKARGKELFTAKCGSCHTLADAGTTGTIGPNLDDAFAESRRNGLGESTFVQVIRDQIAYGIEKTSTGAPGMAENIVTGQDADDVASYIASVAGTGKAPSPTPAEPDTPIAAGDAAAGKIVFTTTASCGGCHTLADAGTTGVVGPNLDESKPDAALVTARVTKGMGAMPSFGGTLDATQIADVVAYVSGAAGK